MRQYFSLIDCQLPNYERTASYPTGKELGYYWGGRVQPQPPIYSRMCIYGLSSHFYGFSSRVHRALYNNK